MKNFKIELDEGDAEIVFGLHNKLGDKKLYVITTYADFWVDGQKQQQMDKVYYVTGKNVREALDKFFQKKTLTYKNKR